MNAAVVAPARSFRVEIVRTEQELAPHRDDWTDLVHNVLEPNAFYEPWMLLPALRAFGAGHELSIALIFDGRQLCGLIPLERRRRVKGAPISCLALWKHQYCFLCTPLLRADCASDAFDAFLDWLRADGVALAEMTHVPGEGPFHELLMERLARRALRFLVEGRYQRAFFAPPPGSDSEDYLRAALNGKRRSEYKRQLKILGRDGPLEWKVLEKADDLSAWVDAFLTLEASGWKGTAGTALGSHDADRAFFRDMTAEAFAAGRLTLLGLFSGGTPIAMKCNFLTPPGSFAFKIAYDESRSHCSPGVQLELENMRRFADHPECRWMDSCAAIPDHPMIDRLWTERRPIQNVMFSTGRRTGNAFLALLPLLRGLKRTFIGQKTHGQARSLPHDRSDT